MLVSHSHRNNSNNNKNNSKLIRLQKYPRLPQNLLIFFRQHSGSILKIHSLMLAFLKNNLKEGLCNCHHRPAVCLLWTCVALENSSFGPNSAHHLGICLTLSMRIVILKSGGLFTCLQLSLNPNALLNFGLLGTENANTVFRAWPCKILNTAEPSNSQWS